MRLLREMGEIKKRSGRLLPSRDAEEGCSCMNSMGSRGGGGINSMVSGTAVGSGRFGKSIDRYS
jgi:hypothetical protein